MDSRPVSWYGVTFFRGNDELKVVTVIFVPMTGVGVVWKLPLRSWPVGTGVVFVGIVMILGGHIGV